MLWHGASSNTIGDTVLLRCVLCGLLHKALFEAICIFWAYTWTRTSTSTSPAWSTQEPKTCREWLCPGWGGGAGASGRQFPAWVCRRAIPGTAGCSSWVCGFSRLVYRAAVLHPFKSLWNTIWFGCMLWINTSRRNMYNNSATTAAPSCTVFQRATLMNQSQSRETNMQRRTEWLKHTTLCPSHPKVWDMNVRGGRTLETGAVMQGMKGIGSKTARRSTSIWHCQRSRRWWGWCEPRKKSRNCLSKN